MADEPKWDDIFSSTPTEDNQAADRFPLGDPRESGSGQAPQSRRELREAGSRGGAGGGRTSRERVDEHGIRLSPRRRRSFAWLWILLAFLIVIAGASTAVYINFGPQIRHVLGIEPPNDYTGTGTGSVTVTIAKGQIGADVAKTLAADGVTMTSKAFYDLLVKQVPQVTFTPGSYHLKHHMSAAAALKALVDPANKVSNQVVIPEGLTVKQIIVKLAALSSVTGVTADQLTAAAADYKSFGLPAAAPNLEGYLFPATYTLQPNETAHQILQTFVTEMFRHLDADGVPVASRHQILTLAALTQKEGGSSTDFLKVARVWDNRIAAGMDLQSDATVSYGAGSTSINTTVAQRADKSNPYNTYAHAGPPIGPISNPGDAAITATLHPAVGTWMYFVVVNCSTGETAFSTTFAQHQAAVAQLGTWLKANPGGCN